MRLTKSFPVVLGLVAMSLPLLSSPLWARTWKIAGKPFEAELISWDHETETVTLRDSRGQARRVSQSLLSEADRAFVAAQSGHSANERRGIEVTKAETEQARRVALLIAVNHYDELGQLRYAVADAEALRKALLKLNFADEDIICLTSEDVASRGATRAAILRQFDRSIDGSFASRLEEADLAVVALSGHGLQHDDQPYFCPLDTQLSDVAGSAIAIDYLYAKLNESKARAKLVLVDACRNKPDVDARNLKRQAKVFGGFSESLAGVSARHGIAVLSSCSPSQLSWEDPELGHGIFLYHVIAGLSGVADREGNGDACVSLLELFAYAETRTEKDAWRKKRANQKPMIKGDTSNFILGELPHIAVTLTVRVGSEAGPPAADVPVAIVRRDTLNAEETSPLVGKRTDISGRATFRVPPDMLKATNTYLAVASYRDITSRKPLKGLNSGRPVQTTVVIQPPRETKAFQDPLLPFGQVPAGWDQVGEVTNDRFEVERKEFSAADDFILEISLTATTRNGFRLTLQGTDGGANLVVQGSKTNAWSGVDTWYFTLPNGNARSGLTPGERTLTLRRKGAVFTLTVDAVFNPQAHSRKIGTFVVEGAKNFDGIRLATDGPGIHIREVRLRPAGD